MAIEHISAKILGRDYRLSCQSEDAEALSQAVQHVENTVNRLSEVAPTKESDRLAIMAAIRIAGEMFSVKDKNGPLGALSVAEAKQRMNELSRQIDAALTPQEHLF